MPGTLSDMPIRFLPLDVVAVAGPLAVLMILAEAYYFWRYGRRPASAASRLNFAVAGLCLAVPTAIALTWWHHSLALLIIGAMMVVWTLHSYHSTTSPISPGTRRLLVAIRLAVVILMLIYLLRPTRQQVEVITEKASLFVLYDTSRSMQITDAGSAGRVARIDEVRAAHEKVDSQLDELTKFFDVQQYTFGETLDLAVRGGGDLELVPKAESTGIGRAVQEAYQRATGKKVAGFIILTDGANNLSGPGTNPLQVANRLGRHSAPVAFWPVGIGRETLTTDQPAVIAKSVELPSDKVPAFNVLTVHSVFELINLPDEPVTVELVFGQGNEAKVADSKTIKAAAGNRTETVSFDLEVIPNKTGFQAVTVRVAPGAKSKSGVDLAKEPAKITDYVQVIDDLIQVLYIEGKFRLESRYLIAALGGSNLMRLNRQYLLTTAALSAGSSRLPKDEADWQKYHVFIFGDVKANAFTAEQLRVIRKMVTEVGKGALFLGGRDAYFDGGWADSPLAGLFPFDLDKARGQLDAKFILTPTSPGIRHQLMRLSDDITLNKAMWDKLPPIQGANRFPSPEEIQGSHPGATILATAGKNGLPVMVAQQAGAGRVLASAIDTTWRWRLHLDEGRELHNRFWRQVVLWLSNREGNVWVQTDQPRYRLSRVRPGTGATQDRQRIVVTAGAEDQTGLPVEDPKATLTEFLPTDKPNEYAQVSIPLPVPVNGKYELELPPPTRDGNYRLVFAATIEEKDVKAETSFIVESPDVELGRPLADLELLRQMAKASEPAGGKFYTIDQFDELLERFESSDYLVKREELRSTELGDRFRWPILVLILIALTAEWMLRKRRNLV